MLILHDDLQLVVLQFYDPIPFWVRQWRWGMDTRGVLHHFTNPLLVPFEWELYVSKDLGQGNLKVRSSKLTGTGRTSWDVKCFCTGKELLKDLKWDLDIFEKPLCSLHSYTICCRSNKGPWTIPTPISSVTRRPFSFLFIAPYGLLQ